ncbi:hypothetical protein D3C80_1487740 [compost metagenome]
MGLNKINKRSLLLYIIASYNVVIILIVLIRALNVFFNSSDSGMTELLLDLFLFSVYSILIITNLFLIFSKEFTRFCLIYNLFFALSQVVHVKLLGVIYEFSSGVEIIPFISLNNGYAFGIEYDIMRIVFTLFYDSSRLGFFVGINIIPLLIFLYFLRMYKQVNFKNNSA